MRRILNTIGRIASGISVVITVVAIILSLTSTVNGATYSQILFLTVPLGIVSAVVVFITGEG